MTNRAELWRIIRFVTLQGNALARLDKQRNVLTVNKSVFDTLTESEQRHVMSTEEDLDYGPRSKEQELQVA